jgi:RNA polymerase sigma-70 factor (ECF subfamily)
MLASPRFHQTPWTVVLLASGPNSPKREKALAELMEMYWYPLFAFLRRQGHAIQEAEDLLQGFIARLLEKDLLRGVQEGHGRFRNFLLICLRNFLVNEAERQRAEKRGGGRKPLSFDVEAADARIRLEPAHDMSPQRLFERDWARGLIEQTYARLAEAWSTAGKQTTFAALSKYLVGREGSLPYADEAARLGMTEGAVKTAVHRLRAQFRRILCEQVAATLDRDDLLEDEIRRLFAALRG